MHTIEVKMTCGCDCGSVMVRPAAAPVSPLEIVAADDIIAGWDAAVRVDTAGAVSVLPDVSGNGWNLTQLVVLSQPTAMVGGGPNGNDSILFDGVDDSLSNMALDLPAPGTTSLTYWAVFRQITWTAGDVLWHGIFILQDGVTPQIRQGNGAPANNNAGMILNTYGLFEALFSNSTSDKILASGVLTTGTSAGNTDPAAGFHIGFNGGTGLANSNIELCELWLFGTALTIQQRSQLRAYATNRYGAIP